MMTDQPTGIEGRTGTYRSRPEGLIAGLLDRYGLPFICEKPTAVMDNSQVRIWYPDFTLSYGLVIEYFGINGNAEYDRRTDHKLRVYAENQYEVLPVYSRDLYRGWEDRLLKRIDYNLESRLTYYRSAVTNMRTRIAPLLSPHSYRR
jgi:hypothetical protein